MSGEESKKFRNEIKNLQKHSKFMKKESTPVNFGDSSIQKVKQSFELGNIFNQDFEIFTAESNLGIENLFPLIAKEVFFLLSLNSRINLDNLDKFLLNARKGYKNNPYHKSLHGVDVMLSIATYIRPSNLIEIAHFSWIDVLSILVSGLLHDIGHPGYNNNFQIMSKSELAMIYNDISVLENYHISEASKLIRKNDCNILSNLSESELKTFRKRLIENILATDMVFHPKIQSVIKSKVTLWNKEKDTFIKKDSESLFDEQQDVLNFIIHTADISHSSKKFESSYKWSMLLMEEFWNQGDLEKAKGMKISFLCDRTTAEVPKSQIGFIRGLIVPLFEVLVDFLPELNYLSQNIEDNLVEWNLLIGDSKEEGFQDKISNLKLRLSDEKSDIINRITEVENENSEDMEEIKNRKETLSFDENISLRQPYERKRSLEDKFKKI